MGKPSCKMCERVKNDPYGVACNRCICGTCPDGYYDAYGRETEDENEQYDASCEDCEAFKEVHGRKFNERSA